MLADIATKVLPWVRVKELLLLCGYDVPRVKPPAAKRNLLKQALALLVVGSLPVQAQGKGGVEGSKQDDWSSWWVLIVLGLVVAFGCLLVWAVGRFFSARRAEPVADGLEQPELEPMPLSEQTPQPIVSADYDDGLRCRGRGARSRRVSTGVGQDVQFSPWALLPGAPEQRSPSVDRPPVGRETNRIELTVSLLTCKELQHSNFHQRPRAIVL